MLNSKLILIATDAASLQLGSRVYFLISLISVLGLLIILSMIVFYRRRMKKLQYVVKTNPFDPSFAGKIVGRVPKLADAELEFCAMLRLNFETKDIASYTGWSIQIIEQKKHRIRKKLRVPSSGDLNS